MEVAKAYARNALTAREMTADQLRTRMAARLSRRFACGEECADGDLIPSVVEEVLKLCASYSLIDDGAFARRRAASSVRAGKSRRVSEMALQAKGIDGETVRASFADYDEMAAALVFLRKKKAGPFAGAEETEDRRRKVMGSFLRSGFSYSLWSRAVALTTDEAEEYLSATWLIVREAN